MISKNSRFEITQPVVMGLVCFRLIGSNNLNEKLINLLNKRKNIHLTPTVIHGRYIIRFAVCSRFTELHDIEFAYEEILTAIEIIDKLNYTEE